MIIKSKKWHAALLIAGANIGAATLGMPSVLAKIGFLPVIILLWLCAIFMSSTAYVLSHLLEKFPSNTHFVTLSNHYLGDFGKYICVSFYFFLSYLSLAAYLFAGMSQINMFVYGTSVSDAYSMLNGFNILYCLLLVGVFVSGRDMVASVNTIFMMLLLTVYFVVFVMVFDDMDFSRLHGEMDFSDIKAPLGTFLTGFSFHMIVPSVRHYLKGDNAGVKRSILLGVIITTCVYFFLILFSLSAIPVETLRNLYVTDQNVSDALIQVLNHAYAKLLIFVFTLCALITSFWGVSYGLRDLISDLFRSYSIQVNRWALVAFVMIPSLLFSLKNHIFYDALVYSGLLGDGVLHGLLPGIMLSVYGYNKNKISHIVTGVMISFISIMIILSDFIG
jgi:tyrosine-specific transport protein